MPVPPHLHRSGVCLALVAWLSLLLFSQTAYSQEAPRLPLQAEALAFVPDPASPAPDEQGAPRPSSLSALYVTFGVLQALDAHTTMATLRDGGREANPLMGGAAGNAAALIAVKTASGLGTVYLVEKLRKRSRVAAMVTMAAITSAYAMIVTHNVRVSGRLGAR